MNRLVEPEKNPLRPKSESVAIVLIWWATLWIFEFFHLSVEAGLDAARSEKLVAGLELVL